MSESENPQALEELATRLGLTLAPRAQSQTAPMNLRWSAGETDEEAVPTFREVSERYLESISGDDESRESARRDLRNHVLPRFGLLRLDQVTESDVLAWLAAKGEVEGNPRGTDSRLHSLLSQIWTLAVRLKLPGAGTNPLEGSLRFDRRGRSEEVLTLPEAKKLLEAAGSSKNRQLKFILSLLMLTGARPGEILSAQACDFDLDAEIWRLRLPATGAIRELRLCDTAVALVARLSSGLVSPYLLANPNTRKPYRSIVRSWEVARSKAGLHHLELDDLRYCDLGAAGWEDELVQTLFCVVGEEHTGCHAAARSPEDPIRADE